MNLSVLVIANSFFYETFWTFFADLGVHRGMIELRRLLLILSVTFFVVVPTEVWAQAGVLLVEGSDVPDPSTLALVNMNIEIEIDHLHATVRLTQIFENRSGRSLRGRYELALGRAAAVSSFALWEGVNRREAVVVERERGQRVFEEATRQNLDPGLLETSDQGPRQNIYALRVDPIAPYQRIRIEVGYSQELSLAAGEAHFVFPLAGRESLEQHVEHLQVDLEVVGAWPLEAVELSPERIFELSSTFSTGQTAARAELDQRNVTLEEDLSVVLRLGPTTEPLQPALLSYRKVFGTKNRVDRSAFGGGRVYTDDRGYFVLSTPLRLPHRSEATSPQDVVVAVDTSLSMRGDKLERAVNAVEGLLERLRPTDRFGLVTFNDEVRQLDGGLASATPARRAEARELFRTGYLSGGTDLGRAIPAALKLLTGSTTRRRTVVLITDGHPSLGQLETSTVSDAVARANVALGSSEGRLFVLGIGDDANHHLLERLAHQSGGLYAHAGEGVDLTPILRSFLTQLDAEVVEDFRTNVEGVEGIEDLLPAGPTQVFDGSAHVLYGRYRTPAPRATFKLRGRVRSRPLEKVLTGALPRSDVSRPWIARGWATRRIDHLLARIDTEGENDDWVGEIVALAREHLLVTPYTSLIAAARSVLRPRDITPGDPTLRVHTDQTDRAVTAIFPFGLIKRLRPIESGLFETRFLAPVTMADGRHDVELVITGADGRQRMVRDHFVIDSQAPIPLISPPLNRARAGSRLPLKVRSDRDTRRLLAYLVSPGGRQVDGPPAELRWSAEELTCLGELQLGASLPTGTYQLVVVAEDHAHNVGSASVSLEVRAR